MNGGVRGVEARGWLAVALVAPCLIVLYAGLYVFLRITGTPAVLATPG